MLLELLLVLKLLLIFVLPPKLLPPQLLPPRLLPLVLPRLELALTVLLPAPLLLPAPTLLPLVVKFNFAFKKCEMEWKQTVCF